MHPQVLLIISFVSASAQNKGESIPDFTKRFMEELSGIFGEQATASKNTLHPPHRINAAESSSVTPDQSSMKRSSLATWIELIRTIADTFRRSSDSSSPHSPSDNANPSSSFSNDGASPQPLRPLTPSNSASGWFEGDIKNPVTGNSEDQHAIPAMQLETGGRNFDRFVLSEEQPFGNPFFQKFTRKGLDWSDGNLRLVDMEGNKLLGSELTVHDRSVDIPLQPWLQAADSLFRPYSQDEVFFTENVY